MKIASWNVNSLNVRLPHVLAWSEFARPDVLALQETKMTDDRFPVDELMNAGYHSIFSGQKNYNGVAVLSREKACDPVTDIPGLEDPQRRILAVTVGDVRIVDLYVVNGSEVGSEKFEYKLHWLEQVTAWNKLFDRLDGIQYAPGNKFLHQRGIMLGSLELNLNFTKA